MTIEKAFQRLTWRFSNGTFTPNQNDLDALKFIAKWVNNTKLKEIQENTLLAKVYTYTFMMETLYYKDLKFAQFKMNEISKKTIREHYDDFAKEVNQMELNKFRYAIGLSDRILDMTPEDIEREDRIVHEHSEDLNKLVIGKYSQDKIDKSLNNQISETINKYKSFP